MLTLIIFFPAIAAMLGFLLDEKSVKFYGVSIAFIELALTLAAWARADFTGAWYQLRRRSRRYFAIFSRNERVYEPYRAYRA